MHMEDSLLINFRREGTLLKGCVSTYEGGRIGEQFHSASLHVSGVLSVTLMEDVKAHWLQLPHRSSQPPGGTWFHGAAGHHTRPTHPGSPGRAWITTSLRLFLPSKHPSVLYRFVTTGTQ